MLCVRIAATTGPGAFATNDVVPVSSRFKPVVTQNGVIETEWTGQEEVHWEGQRRNLQSPRYHCCACIKDFRAFTVLGEAEAG